MYRNTQLKHDKESLFLFLVFSGTLHAWIHANICKTSPLPPPPPRLRISLQQKFAPRRTGTDTSNMIRRLFRDICLSCQPEALLQDDRCTPPLPPPPPAPLHFTEPIPNMCSRRRLAGAILLQRWSVSLTSAMYISKIKMENSMRHHKQSSCLYVICSVTAESPGERLCFHSFMVGHESHSHSDEETQR